MLREDKFVAKSGTMKRVTSQCKSCKNFKEGRCLENIVISGAIAMNKIKCRHYREN